MPALFHRRRYPALGVSDVVRIGEVSFWTRRLANPSSAALLRRAATCSEICAVAMTVWPPWRCRSLRPRRAGASAGYQDGLCHFVDSLACPSEHERIGAGLCDLRILRDGATGDPIAPSTSPSALRSGMPPANVARISLVNCGHFGRCTRAAVIQIASLFASKSTAVQAFFLAMSMEPSTAPSIRRKHFRWPPPSRMAMFIGAEIRRHRQRCRHHGPDLAVW